MERGLGDGDVLKGISDHDHIEWMLRIVAACRPTRCPTGVQIPVLKHLVRLKSRLKPLKTR